MTDEIERLIADIRLRLPTADEETLSLVRRSGDVKTFRAALDMYALAPRVWDGLVRTLHDTYVVLETKPQAGEEVKEKMATINPTGKPTSEPRPISKEELRALIPEWKKEATTFEPAPLLEFAVGESYLVRLKRVIKGAFEAPLTIAGEFASVDESGNIGPVTAEERKIPSYMVRRALGDNVKLVSGLVYFMTLAGTKATAYGNDYLQGKVKLIGSEFPK